ncbi:MAG: hypothetical protein HY908_22685 [Myxococcales bacterium]|nr:hypothetical protein [Myxococcales bacterium]
MRSTVAGSGARRGRACGRGLGAGVVLGGLALAVLGACSKGATPAPTADAVTAAPEPKSAAPEKSAPGVARGQDAFLGDLLGRKAVRLEGPSATPTALPGSPPTEPKATAVAETGARGAGDPLAQVPAQMALPLAADPAAPPRADAQAAPVGFRSIRGVGFAFALPTPWLALPEDVMKQAPILGGGYAPTPSGDFSTNVNLLSEPFPGAVSEYVALNLDMLRQQAKVLGRQDVVAGKRPAVDVVAEWGGAVPYRTLQRYATDGARGFVLTCSAGVAAWDAERPLCDKIVATLRLGE